MNLFRDLGKRAEKLKQQVAASDEKTYRCADCGTEVRTDREACPDCGGDDLRRVQ
ncbi:zinc ribbon domain-containing protein [Halorussus aquaticus]|uniref:Zinc ribbon domain-containing protein n=1 Tax=Halorussus aquaticus TaxID=2953748 RepID=A0ABD5Q6Y2_9EURY|nr:zinc ribbon domain-containing protein [Halorussus aquaticus]